MNIGAAIHKRKQRYRIGVEVLLVVGGGRAHSVDLDREHNRGPERLLDLAELAGYVAAREETESIRWIWPDTRTVLPPLLAAAVRPARCWDLRMCRRILSYIEPATAWQPAPWHEETHGGEPTLLDSLQRAEDERTLPEASAAALAEYRQQRHILSQQAGEKKLQLLLAAESAGALVAAEMNFDGLPWDRAKHDRILTETLGERSGPSGTPRVMAELAEAVRTRLGQPQLNLDSPASLRQGLQRAGIDVANTSKWTLQNIDHPAIAPLLRYKKLSRLLSANGWTWMQQWIKDAPTGARQRYYPEFVPGGVVTGRWATSGGGALQLPKQLRAAVRADDGWKLIVADAAQMEPRVLAGMSGDENLARAARGHDLYQGLVDTGVIGTRKQAKVAMLGALYGATSGEGGQLMPRLRTAYPQAVALVDRAAAEGERGQRVSTWLGRTSPLPSAKRWAIITRGRQVQATEAEQRAARSAARDWGRFTRNFVVQGTAAELALCWLGELRRQLRQFPLPNRPRLVYFLHDEVIVHAPAELAEQVRDQVSKALTRAAGLLFGHARIDFPLSIAIVDSYDEAEH